MFVVPCNATVLSSWTEPLLPVILNGAAGGVKDLDHNSVMSS